MWRPRLVVWVCCAGWLSCAGWLEFAGATEEPFLRGDSNGDGRLNLADAVFTLGYAFRGTRTPDCLDAADANDDGRIDISDAIVTVGFLFRGRASPPPPYPLPGTDPTPDANYCADTRGTLALEWDPVEEDVEGNPEEVSYYTVYHGTAPGDYTGARFSVTTSAVLIGLESDRLYYVAVTATDRRGNESDFSAEIAARSTRATD